MTLLEALADLQIEIAAQRADPKGFDFDAMMKTLLAVTLRLQQIHDDLRAHGSHWRQPYQAFCYDMADLLDKKEL